MDEETRPVSFSVQRDLATELYKGFRFGINWVAMKVCFCKTLPILSDANVSKSSADHNTPFIPREPQYVPPRWRRPLTERPCCCEDCDLVYSLGAFTMKHSATKFEKR